MSVRRRIHQAGVPGGHTPMPAGSKRLATAPYGRHLVFLGELIADTVVVKGAVGHARYEVNDQNQGSTLSSHLRSARILVKSCDPGCTGVWLYEYLWILIVDGRRF